jgi:hypothetical protein
MSDQAERQPSHSGSETRRRGALVGFRATVAELAEIDAQAERAGLTRSSYARAQLLAAPKMRAQRRPNIDRVLLAQAVSWLGRAAGSLYQIARHLNFGHVEAAADVSAALAEVRGAISAIMAVTGQRPREAEGTDAKEREAA